jgi:succinate dehydrogenase flavin-adding protein (antitoxin of CptAB toxin-antitoxin module)
MDLDPLERRAVLAGTVLTIAGAAGCNTNDGDSRTETPGNEEDTPAETAEETATEAARGTPGETTDRTPQQRETPAIDGTDDIKTAPMELPPSARWLAGPDARLAGPIDETHVFLSVDLQRLATVELYDQLFEELAFDSSTDDQQQARLAEAGVTSYAEALPISTGSGVLVAVGLLMGARPVLRDVEFVGLPIEEGEVGDPIMTVESIAIAGDRGVFGGELHRGALDADNTIEAVAEREPFTIYEQKTSETSTLFAASDDTMLSLITGYEREYEQTLLGDYIEMATDGELDADEAWLLERVGDGVFDLSVAGPTVSDELANDIFTDIVPDQNAVETVQSFGTNVDAVHMTADGNEDGRVTRSGFLFQSEDALANVDEFVDAVATDAPERDVIVDDRKIVIEAFWQ